jgi:gluconolactonase
VDVPYGRILKRRVDEGAWTVLADYDGEPNGMAIRDDGMLVVADYKQGMVSFCITAGRTNSSSCCAIPRLERSHLV